MDLKNAIVEDRNRGTFRVHRSTMTSPEIYQMEQERIFQRCWLYVGHESEVPKPGDYLRRNVGGQPIMFVRGSDGQPRVFLNTCPHRGALVCRQGRGNARRRTHTRSGGQPGWRHTRTRASGVCHPPTRP